MKRREEGRERQGEVQRLKTQTQSNWHSIFYLLNSAFFFFLEMVNAKGILAAKIDLTSLVPNGYIYVLNTQLQHNPDMSRYGVKFTLSSNLLSPPSPLLISPLSPYLLSSKVLSSESSFCLPYFY